LYSNNHLDVTRRVVVTGRMIERDQSTRHTVNSLPLQIHWWDKDNSLV